MTVGLLGVGRFVLERRYALCTMCVGVGQGIGVVDERVQLRGSPYGEHRSKE